MVGRFCGVFFPLWWIVKGDFSEICISSVPLFGAPEILTSWGRSGLAKSVHSFCKTRGGQVTGDSESQTHMSTQASLQRKHAKPGIWKWIPLELSRLLVPRKRPLTTDLWLWGYFLGMGKGGYSRWLLTCFETQGTSSGLKNLSYLESGTNT